MTEFEKALEVTQADRDAAEEVCAMMRRGDAVDFNEAFARHRIASLSTHKAAPVSDGVVERARDLLAAEYRTADLPFVFDLAVPNERDAAALRAIERALSGLDEAIEALEPFARAGEALPSWARGHNTLSSYPGFCGGLDAGDLRRARTVADKLRSAS